MDVRYQKERPRRPQQTKPTIIHILGVGYSISGKTSLIKCYEYLLKNEKYGNKKV